jgi:hypothetical protein
MLCQHGIFCRQTYTLRRFGFGLQGSIPDPHFWGNPNPFSRNTYFLIRVFANPKYFKSNFERGVYGMDSGQEYTDGLKRAIQIKFRVTETERDLIYGKMRLLGTNNLAAYMRKIAIDGYIINTDNSDLKAIAAELQKIGVNFNQIARKVNSMTRFYEQDFDEMKRGYDEQWRLLRLSLLKAR